MAFQRLAMSLAAAVLSNGAQLVAAGSGLPQRIREATDKYLQGIAVQSSGVAIDPDGLHVWVCGATNSIKKVRISDGVTVATFTNNASDGGTRTINTPRSLVRRGNFVYFCSSGTGNYLGRIDCTTLVCRLYAQATVTSPSFITPDGTNVWARNTPTGAATMTEFSLSLTGDAATATATGRTVASNWGMVVDNAGVYAYFTDGTNITRYTLIGGATTTLGTISGSIQEPFGYGNVWRALAWDSVNNKLLVFTANLGYGFAWWRMNVGAGMTTAQIEGRAFGAPEFGSPINANANGGGFTQIAFSDDGTQVAFLYTDNNVVLDDVRIVNLSAQRAQWNWTPGIPVTVREIAIPGMFGNERGAIANVLTNPAYLTGVYEYERTKFYYSVDGVNFTKFTPGDDLNVAVSAVQTLTVRAEIQRKIDVLWVGPRPYIGGTNNEGIKVWYDDGIPAPTVYVPTGGGAFKGRLLAQPALKGRLGA